MSGKNRYSTLSTDKTSKKKVNENVKGGDSKKRASTQSSPPTKPTKPPLKADSSKAVPQPSKPSSTAPKEDVQSIFLKYAGKGDESSVIADDNLGKFCKAMNMDIEGPGPYLLAWKLNANNFASYSRDEFIKGFTALGITTESKMKDKIKEILEKEWKNADRFGEFYKWLWTYCLGQSDKKTLEIEVAMEVWSAVLPPHFQLLKSFLDFLLKQKIKVCSRDLWDQTWNFAHEISPDLSNWDENGAWPSVIDDFVEEIKSKENSSSD